MNYALFLGCKIPFYLEQYGVAVRAVMKKLDVGLVDMEFNCCGYPIRSLDFEAFVLSGARNIALAEKKGLDIMTPCKCCFGSLKHTNHMLREHPELRDRINRSLAAEDLKWEGSTVVKHLLTVLDQDVTTEKIAASLKNTYSGLKIAAHYGCHALRPSNVTGFDNALNPTIFERLVALTGAEPVDWSLRLDCCGNPLRGQNDRLALNMMRRKVENARQSGAHYLSTACTYCQIQFDTAQAADAQSTNRLPAVTYPQLLGLPLGLPESVLGLRRNMVDATGLKKYLA